MATALAGGCEAVALREGVGVVVADVAGFLPWATEDTINARSVLGFWPTRVVPESSRVVGRLFWMLEGRRGGWEEVERASDQTSAR